MRGWLLGILLAALLAGPACMRAAHADGAPPPPREISLAPQTASIGDPVPDWVEPVEIPPDTHHRAQVLRLSDAQVHVGDAPAVFSRSALAVNDAAALTTAGQINIDFVPDYQRLQLHYVRILRGNEVLDRTQSASIRFLERETGLEQGMYSGDVTAVVLINDLRVGDTVEWAWTRTGENPVFGGRFVDSAAWGRTMPTEYRRVLLTYPADRHIAWRLLGPQDKNFSSIETRAGGQVRLEFTGRNMDEYTWQKDMPPDYNWLPWLQFSEFTDWGDVVRWAEALFHSAAPEDGGVAAEVAKLRALPDDAARVSAALEFVQSTVRYFSVSLGENSHRPAPPETVLERSYGDCKDKSLLLITLLRRLGIEAHPVLLDARHDGDLQAMLPSPGAFDHAIVQVLLAGQTYYLDPTRLDQYGKLDRMGQVHQGAPVLVIAPGVDAITQIPRDPADRVIDEISESATLEKFGAAASLEQRHRWTGALAEYLRGVLANGSPEKFSKFYNDAMERRFPGARPFGTPLFQDDRQNNELSLLLRYSVPQIATETQQSWLFRLDALNMQNTLPPPPGADRQVPLGFGAYPLSAAYRFELTLPPETSGAVDPTGVKLDAPFLHFSESFSFRGNVARAEWRLALPTDRVPVTELARYGELQRQIEDSFPRNMVIGKSAVVQSPPQGAKPPGLEQVMHDRLQRSVDAISLRIKAGLVTGDLLSELFCQRSELLADLGQTEAALRDADAAVKLSPGIADFQSCLANAAYMAGDFHRSIEVARAAIALGADPAQAWRARGLATFFAGDFKAAAADFATSAANDADTENRLYAQIWQGVSLLRAGAELPKDWQTQALADPHGAWPRPVLAMLAGSMPPEEVLAQLTTLFGDEHTMALAEARFYIAEFMLAQGDRPAAHSYLEQTRALGVLMFIEHIAAGFELARM